jgi:hypothetical protein
LVNYISLKFLDDADKAIRRLSSKVHFDSDIITFSNRSTATNSLVSAGMFIHRGFPSGVNVNNWSEGCQVFSKDSDYKQLIALARYHIKKHGNKFNYTLLEGREVA